MNQEFNTDRMLIEKYLDRVLSKEDTKKAEALIAGDASAREIFAEMQTAVITVKYAAINQQVAAAAQNYFGNLQQQQAPQNKGFAKVISLKRAATYSLRVAAAIILIAGSYTAFRYHSVNSDALYAEGFIPYDISVTRNNTALESVEMAYQQQNWQLVLNAAKQQPASQKINFLAGMAALQLGQFQEALTFFNRLDLINKQSTEKLYVDDAEYYLALTYLKTGEVNKATKMLKSISANPLHQYRQAARNINGFELMLLNYKAH